MHHMRSGYHISQRIIVDLVKMQKGASKIIKGLHHPASGETYMFRILRGKKENLHVGGSGLRSLKF